MPVGHCPAVALSSQDSSQVGTGRSAPESLAHGLFLPSSAWGQAGSELCANTAERRLLSKRVAFLLPFWEIRTRRG